MPQILCYLCSIILPWTWVRVAAMVEPRIGLVPWFLHLVDRISLRLRVVCVRHGCVGAVAARRGVIVGRGLRGRGYTPHCGYHRQRLLGSSPTALPLPSNIRVTEEDNRVTQGK
jgi:hypothetical protein